MLVIGTSVLTAWCLDDAVVKGVLRDVLVMKANVAVALCLGTLSLLLFTLPTVRGESLQRTVSITFAATMGAIGALTLVQYLSGANLGIDELLFRDQSPGTSRAYPAGRMAPISAFNSFCLGLALILIHRRETTLWAQALTGCAAFTSMLAIVGHFFSVETLYRSGNFTAVALHGALSFIVLCSGLWCVTHDFGFMRVVTGSRISGSVVRRFGLAALVLPLLISWLHLQAGRHGWYEADFGQALFAMINVTTFALLIWFGAVSLRKAELKEAVVQDRLRCAHRDLENRVRERTNALETSLHVNQQIMDYSLDVICIIDGVGRFTTVSRACEKVWGYTPAELVGRHFIQLVHPEDHEKTNQTAADIVNGHVVRDFENRYVRKDGSAVFMTWSVYWSEDKELMFCVARDATERKRAEAALRQATEDAERANRAKSEFLANMSHEIRTPMNGILGMTELTLDTQLDHEQREYLGMVKTSAHSLLGVINDILDFSKIEAGKLEMESLSFSLRDAIGVLLKPLAVRADEKQLELLADIPADVPDHMIGDPLRLRQILLNLIDNAIKFTERGEVVVQAVTESTADGETELHFSITDTGIGIPEEKQAAIFEAFAQVDGSTTRHYGGTGLGLAITTRLVQQMRGRIWVESRLGFGTTFHFTIWLRTSAAPLQEVTAINALHLAGLRALIVDDNALNCRILQEMLANWGMQPTAVRSARAALDLMREAAAEGQPFPLILLDAMMPEMDGFALAESIKQEPLLAGATVMMLSSAMHSGEMNRANGLGIHSVLSKPVMQSELLEGILLALGSKEVPTAATSPRAAATSGPVTGQLEILVAEDNAINRAVITGMLGRRGHQVTHATNGLEAVEAISTKRFDLLLMDIQMPEIDGFEATRRIRQLEEPRARQMRIVAMTAHAMAGDRERCLAAGMDDYISKPLRAVDLDRVLAAADLAAPRLVPVKNDASVYTHPELLEQCGGDEELLAELVVLFATEAPRFLDVLHEAVAQQNAPALAAGAHKLLGSLGAFGAVNAREIAVQLGKDAAESNFSRAHDGIVCLADEVRRIHSTLASYAAPLACPALHHDHLAA